MALNVPTVTREDISFGPGRLFVGAAGATPTADLGAISEDGISVEISSETKEIMQGNPKIPEMRFIQAQSVSVKATGIEWNLNNFVYALGAGVTSASGTHESLEFGGEPCGNEVALHVQHQMCQSGDTLNLYVWRAAGDGSLPIPFTHDEHQFEMSWMALRASTDWAGNSLASNKSLFKLQRQL